MTVYTSYTGVEDSVRVIIAIALAIYVVAWICLVGGLFWMILSVSRFKRLTFWWVLRKGVPWFSPKILAIPILLVGLVFRAVWILLTLSGGPIEAQFIFINWGFVILMTHLSLFLCFWADTLLFFKKQQWGTVKKEGFFTYHVTRWTWVGLNVLLYTVQIAFTVMFLVAVDGSSIEDDYPGLIYNINLWFFCGVLSIILTCFLIFGILLWKFVLNSAHLGKLWRYVTKATFMLLVLGFIELVKLGLLAYKASTVGYSSGVVPYEAYLILVFFIPDLVPAFIFTFAELFSRRRIILRTVEQMDSVIQANRERVKSEKAKRSQSTKTTANNRTTKNSNSRQTAHRYSTVDLDDVERKNMLLDPLLDLPGSDAMEFPEEFGIGIATTNQLYTPETNHCDNNDNHGIEEMESNIEEMDNEDEEEPEF